MSAFQHLITTIQDGVIDPNPRWGVPLNDVEANRNRLFQERGLKSFVRMGAVHGNDIFEVTQDNRAQFENKITGGPSVDSLVTRIPGIGLECDPGDCAVVIAYHPDYHVIGVTHSGREGTIKKIVGKTIQKLSFMVNVPLNVFVEKVQVKQAPNICGRHYQLEYLVVPDDDIEQWQKCIIGNTEVTSCDVTGFSKLVAKENTMGVDFGAFIYQDLMEIGVKPENVQRSEICTYESEEYPSHYRARDLGSTNGRFMVMGWMCI